VIVKEQKWRLQGVDHKNMDEKTSY